MFFVFLYASSKVSFVRIISSASNRSSFSRILLKSSSCPTLEKILSTGTSVGGMLSNLKAISLNGENIGPNIFSELHLVQTFEYIYFFEDIQIKAS